MKQFNSYDEFLNEQFNRDGIILLKGKKLEDGTRRLYALHLRGGGVYSRKKASNEPGSPARMAHLGKDNVYRISFNGNELTAGKVPPNDKLLDAMGLTRWSVVLNSNKTPLHDLTMDETYPIIVLRKYRDSILALKNIRWER